MSSLEEKVLVMENLKSVSRYEMSKSGFLVGFRVWTLKAFSSNGLICEVSEKRDNNYLKYVDLINKLISKGYKLTERQRNEMKNSDFMNKSWLPYASKSDFVTIGRLAGFTESDYINIKNNHSQRIQKLFAERLGLEYHELCAAFNKF
jgi:hypothetical protein